MSFIRNLKKIIVFTLQFVHTSHNNNNNNNNNNNLIFSMLVFKIQIPKMDV